jgi:hypothetical protein
MSRGGTSVGRLSLATLVAFAALGASATTSEAAVTIGQTFTPDVGWGGSGTIIQTTSPGGSYVVPSDGVITRWSFEAAAETAPPLKLKILRPAGGNDFTTVGESQLETPTSGTLNSWPTRIPVKAGDLLGEYYSNDITPLREDSSYHSNEISSGSGDPSVDPPPGTTANYPPSGGDYQIDAAAVLEPDADQDAFGDETQDKCVGTPGNFNGCPNTVAIDKLKQKGDTKVQVTASVPGAGTLAVGSANDKALASASAKSLKAVTTTVNGTTKQQVKLTVKLTKSAIGKLKNSGKLKLKVKAVYTPAGGPPGSATKKKKLKS